MSSTYPYCLLEERKFTPQETVTIPREVCVALEAAHAPCGADGDKGGLEFELLRTKRSPQCFRFEREAGLLP